MTLAAVDKMNSETIMSDELTINKLKSDNHWVWMAGGWQDFRASWRASLKIGALVVLVSLALVLTLYKSSLGAFIPAAYGAFALFGPLIATSIYGISRKLEEDDKVRQLRTVNMRPSSPAQVGFIGFALLVLVLIWSLLALLIYVLAVGFGAPIGQFDFVGFVLSTPQGLVMMVLGTIVGAILALIGYALAVISIPLAFDRDIDALTAMAISVNAVIQNPMVMLSWAFSIAVIIALSAPLLFLPMIVIFPWLGHVTWRAYRDIVS